MRILFCAGLLTIAACTASQPESPTPFDGERLSPITVTYTTQLPTPDGQMQTIRTVQTLESVDLADTSAWRLTSRADGLPTSYVETDWWDRESLVALRREMQTGDTRLIFRHYTDAVEITKVAGGDSTTSRVPVTGTVISDGLINQLALGTLPLEPGYRTTYRSFVKADEAAVSHTVVVKGTDHVRVAAGEFDCFVIETQAEKPDAPTVVWYVNREAPRIAVKMTAPRPGGGTADIELVSFTD